MANPEFNSILADALAEQKTITNADRIRAMSDEELVEAFIDGCDGRECPGLNYECVLYPLDESLKQCRRCWLKYLQSPVDGGAE